MRLDGFVVKEDFFKMTYKIDRVANKLDDLMTRSEANQHFIKMNENIEMKMS
jgi:hypothetical protein